MRTTKLYFLISSAAIFLFVFSGTANAAGFWDSVKEKINEKFQEAIQKVVNPTTEETPASESKPQEESRPAEQPAPKPFWNNDRIIGAATLLGAGLLGGVGLLVSWPFAIGAAVIGGLVMGGSTAYVVKERPVPVSKCGPSPDGNACGQKCAGLKPAVFNDQGQATSYPFGECYAPCNDAYINALIAYNQCKLNELYGTIKE